MISWPYTKLMNSNNMVDQGAALILTSVEAAHRDWAFRPIAGCTRTRAPTRTTPTRSASAPNCTGRRPSGSAARRALELAGLGIDDIDYVDVYSCFPSAVQVAANELGLPRRRPRPRR